MLLQTVALETLLRHGVRTSYLRVRHWGRGPQVVATEKVLTYFLLRGGIGLERAELTRNSNAHILTIPSHAAEGSYFTILSASV